MDGLELQPETVSIANLDVVAVKAFVRLTRTWDLTNDEAAALLDVAPRTWARIKQSGTAQLSQDQRLRVSALVGLYKGLHLYFSESLADRWIKRPNSGPLYQGASPLQHMREGGLPAILQSRNYIDAVRGGV